MYTVGVEREVVAGFEQLWPVKGHVSLLPPPLNFHEPPVSCVSPLAKRSTNMRSPISVTAARAQNVTYASIGVVVPTHWHVIDSCSIRRAQNWRCPSNAFSVMHISTHRCSSASTSSPRTTSFVRRTRHAHCGNVPPAPSACPSRPRGIISMRTLMAAHSR
jgi:hypothetical protein